MTAARTAQTDQVIIALADHQYSSPGWQSQSGYVPYTLVREPALPINFEFPPNVCLLFFRFAQHDAWQGFIPRELLLTVGRSDERRSATRASTCEARARAIAVAARRISSSASAR